MNRQYLVFIFLPALLLSSPSVAKEHDFPDVLNVDGQDLKQAGAGGLYKWFIKGCDMALYVPVGTRRQDVLKDVPKCLEFFYYHNIRADQFAYAAWHTLERNWKKETLDTNKSAIDKLHGIYRDVSKGDTYRLLYIPGAGTKLFLNGKLLGTVEGNDFARIYYSVWLGKEPISEKLKEHLLEDLK